MVVLSNKVVRGTAADIVLEIKNTSSDFIDADSLPTVDVLDPRSQVVVSTGSTTRESLGRYVYQYQGLSTDKLGNYKAIITAVVDNRTELMLVVFEVVDLL